MASATAALDFIAEAENYTRFDEIAGDTIAVFDKGRIVQLGTHEELLADAGGKYYELWNA